MYELFEHTADLGLRMRASTLEELFADAARGLFSVIVTDLHEVQPVCERRFQLESDGCDYLLFDWLNELLYTFDSERLIFTEFEIRINGNSLEAVCRGETFDLNRHGADHEVKAITYHGLNVTAQPDGWSAEVIVDI